MNATTILDWLDVADPQAAIDSSDEYLIERTDGDLLIRLTREWFADHGPDLLRTLEDESDGDWGYEGRKARAAYRTWLAKEIRRRIEVAL